MFIAIRDFFSRPDEPRPRRGRGRRLLALFTFEFAVVVLGVLAAQVLQDWFAQRNEARRVREAVVELHSEFERFSGVAEYRVRADACESARIARLADLAASGGRAGPRDLVAPMMPMPSITPWSDETRAAVLRNGGQEDVKAYDTMSLLARMISERQRRLEDQWADFRLLSPENGQLTTDGRTAMMLAAARARGLLDAMDSNAYEVTKLVPPTKRLLAIMIERTAKSKHPCASAAKTPFTVPGT